MVFLEYSYVGMYCDICTQDGMLRGVRSGFDVSRGAANRSRFFSPPNFQPQNIGKCKPSKLFAALIFSNIDSVWEIA